MHSPEPGEKYALTVEEVVEGLLEHTDIQFLPKNAPAIRRGRFVRRTSDGKFEFTIIGYGPKGVRL